MCCCCCWFLFFFSFIYLLLPFPYILAICVAFVVERVSLLFLRFFSLFLFSANSSGVVLWLWSCCDFSCVLQKCTILNTENQNQK